MERWRVHKFGGSSVADARCMERVAAILEDDPRRRLAVVLSACRGITDALLGVVTAAEQQAEDVHRAADSDSPAPCRHRRDLLIPTTAGESSSARPGYP